MYILTVQRTGDLRGSEGTKDKKKSLAQKDLVFLSEGLLFLILRVLSPRQVVHVGVFHHEHDHQEQNAGARVPERPRAVDVVLISCGGASSAAAAAAAAVGAGRCLLGDVHFDEQVLLRQRGVRGHKPLVNLSSAGRRRNQCARGVRGVVVCGGHNQCQEAV